MGDEEARTEARPGEDVHPVYLRGNVQVDNTVWGVGSSSEKAWGPHRAAHGPLAWETVNPEGAVGVGYRANPDERKRGRSEPEAESRGRLACRLRRAMRLQSCRPGRLQKPQGPSGKGVAPLASKNPPPRATKRPTQPGSASRTPGPCLGLSPSSHFREATCRRSIPPSPPQHRDTRHPRATLNQQRPQMPRGAAAHRNPSGHQKS